MAWLLARDHYLNGYCHVFALALSRRFGFGLAAFRDEDNYPIHVVCLNADGDFVDVNGVLDEASLRASMPGGDIAWIDRHVSEDTVMRWVRFEALRPVTVKSIAQADQVINMILRDRPDHFVTCGQPASGP